MVVHHATLFLMSHMMAQMHVFAVARGILRPTNIMPGDEIYQVYSFLLALHVVCYVLAVQRGRPRHRCSFMNHTVF